MRSVSRLLIAGVLTLSASPAFALFDAQLLAGKRWYEWKAGSETYGYQANQITVAAHVDPIPLVPVSFGVGINSMTLNTKDFSSDPDTSSVFEAGIEVMAWVPMVPIVTPYGRFNYPVTGKYIEKGKVEAAGVSTDYAVTGDVSGYHLGLGAELGALPLIKFLFEVGMSSQKIKIDEYKVGGSKQPLDSDSDDFSSKYLLVGIEVGF